MNAASVKGKLKNIARDTGRSFQDLLISYGLERTIYRLSVSRWNSFAKKKKISLNVSLEDTIALIKDFLAPIITAMQEEDGYEGHWDSNKREWML